MSAEPEPGAAQGSGESPPPPLPHPLPAVVALGASAGALEAYRRLLQALPPDTGAAFLVVQHLDPDHESHLASLLARYTAMPVLPAEDGLAPAQNHVYAIPPNATLTLEDGRLRVRSPSRPHGHRAPVDELFESLARELGERAVAVVLSGTGDDGSRGLRAVKEAGGLVLVQAPEDAAYPGMPASALRTGLVDKALAAPALGAALAAALSPLRDEAEGGPLDEHLQAVLSLLAERAGRDFRHYKRSSLLRRVRRRMALARALRAADYVELLRADAEELRRLERDLLIGVTSFFREPEAFQALSEGYLRPLLEEREPETPLRVWVPGCSTGEEAYSLAMLISDELQRAKRGCGVVVFATDIDEGALATARAGLYSTASAANVPPALARRFLRPAGEDACEVTKDLRRTVVFAPQNLLGDPPFSRLDLVSCRNLLIYLEPPVQRRVLSLFHFALKPDAALLLGSSESASAQAELFEPISPRWRLYRRLPTRSAPLRLPALDPPPAPSARSGPARRPRSPRELAEAELLRRYAPPAAVVNRHGEVGYVIGDVSPFLSLPAGEPTRDAVALARRELRGALRSALRKAAREGHEVTARASCEEREVQLRAQPLDEGRVLVCFEATPSAPPPPPPENEGGAVGRLAAELESTREDLQRTVEELGSSNEELRISHEELMSLNEELQSANEELETSQEELSSLNEELSAVNAQLQEKVHEQEALNDDLTNLLRCTEVAALFLDPSLRIRRFTPASQQLMNLIPSDLGRPLGHITRRFEDPRLVADIQRVLETRAPAEAEVQAEGRWYRRRVTLYQAARPRAGQADPAAREESGVVVTFTDVDAERRGLTAAERARDELEARVEERTAALQASHDALAAEVEVRAAAEASLRSVLDTATDAIVTVDGEGIIVGCNRATEHLFGYGRDELLGASVTLLMAPADAQSHERAMERFLRTREPRVIGVGREVLGQRKDGVQLPLELSLGYEQGPRGDRFVGLLRDLRERKSLEAQLLRAQKLEALGRLASGMTHEFKNLLMGIAGAAHMVREALPPDSPARPHADELTHAIERGLELTRRLLSFGPQAQAHPGPARLDEAVRDVEPLLRHLLSDGREDPPRLLVELGAPALVKAPASDLERALLNLVLNARDACRPGGKIEVQTRTLTLLPSEAARCGVAPGEFAALIVSDDGCGMDLETRTRAFEPFFTTKPATLGTGLGLPMVHGIARRAGGFAELDSAPGLGTTVRVYLPTATQEATPAAADLPPASRGDEVVLLVEDDSLVRLSVRFYLEGAGYEVLPTSTLAEALETWSRERARIDLVLSDLALPDAQGAELDRRLRAEGAELPVLYMSALPPEAAARELGLALGEVLEKPFPPEELLRRVRARLDR
ncbi:MAG: chemotaxis protein CheB [Planctomycetota bacterium]